MFTPRTILVRTGFSHVEYAEDAAERLEKHHGIHPANIEIGRPSIGFSVEVECDAGTVADIAAALEAM